MTGGLVAGLEWHGQLLWALSSLSPLLAAQVAKQSHSDKIQRGEAPAGGGAGVTGLQSSNVTTSHEGGLCPQSMPSSGLILVGVYFFALPLSQLRFLPGFQL